jgi:hypothetical protein
MEPLICKAIIFDLTNLVKSPTCYTKNSNPSLNDAILSNMPNNCMNVTNFNCGISDVKLVKSKISHTFCNGVDLSGTSMS